MGVLINVDGLNGIYAKVKQVNVKNKQDVEVVTNEETQETTETELTTRPMDIVVQTYSDVTKKNKIKVLEFTGKSYDPDAADKDPVNQAYEIVKPLLDVVEDILEDGQSA